MGIAAQNQTPAEKEPWINSGSLKETCVKLSTLHTEKV